MDYTSFLKLMQAVSPIISGYAGGSAAGLVNEGNLTAQQNQGATSRYQALVNAGRLQNIEQPNANLDQGTRGSVLSTFQPVKVQSASVPYGSQTNGAVRPTITGGPSITPELRQLGSQVTRDALSRQMAGNPLATNTFPSDEQLGMTPPPKASTFDKIMGYAGTASSVLGALPKAGGAAAGAGGAGAAAPYPVGSAANGGIIMSDGSVIPAPGAGGGAPVPIGLGGAAPSSSWFTPTDQAKQMQNSPGSASSYLPNPYSEYGSTGVPDPMLSQLLGLSRSYRR